MEAGRRNRYLKGMGRDGMGTEKEHDEKICRNLGVVAHEIKLRHHRQKRNNLMCG